MPQHIGVIGVSPEGSALFYRFLARLISEMPDQTTRPRVTIHAEPFAQYVNAIQADDWATVGHLLAESANTLARAGADFYVLPNNATHHALPLAAAASPSPFVNMVEIVADAIQSDGYAQIGLIGTRYVTFGSTYQTVLGLRGIKLNVPETNDAEDIDRIIFQEAVHGSVSKPSIHRVAAIVDNLASIGCEAIVLGASEASLMLDNDHIPLPVIDPVELLARTTLVRAADEAEVP